MAPRSAEEYVRKKAADEALHKAIAAAGRSQYVNLKFVDLRGAWLTLQVPKDVVSEKLFKEGLNFDGSSV